MARVLKPPTPIPSDGRLPSVFLAGSIEMGAAEDWQTQLACSLADLDVLILNPRRDEWDASWVQSIANPMFSEQVEWELTGLESADVVAMYFAPATKAPVTLLELGLCVRSEKVVACCPDGFWRRGNVEVVCQRYRVPLVEDLPALAVEVRRRLTPLSGKPEWWSVWRIDDNGNTFVVREHLDRAEAERLVAEFTARGHKQMYWTEREAGAVGPAD